jgi:hypothetical protein
MTHDAFSELWFDDIPALTAAARSTEWQAVEADGETLFANPIGVVIARERVQREIGE